MAKTRKHTSRTFEAHTGFEEQDLQATMQEFLQEEKEANTNIWNVATISGIAMFFVGMLFIMQMIGIQIGPDFSGLINVLPLIGGILITLIGFGFLVGDRKKDKSRKKQKRSKGKRYRYDYGEGGETTEHLHNDLGTKSSSSTASGTEEDADFDAYAFSQPKKLYKSRTDKKWLGVCGGLAKYFGISSTVIRLLFAITFFAGSGTSLLVYIALGIVLDKEPVNPLEDIE